MRQHLIFKLVKTSTSSRPPKKSYRRFSTKKVTFWQIFSVFIFFLEIGPVNFSLVLHVILDVGPLPSVKNSAKFRHKFGHKPLTPMPQVSFIIYFFCATNFLVRARRWRFVALWGFLYQKLAPRCPATPTTRHHPVLLVAVVFFFRYSY